MIKEMNLNQSRREKDIVRSILCGRYSHIDHEWGVIFDIFDIFGFAKVDENDELIPFDQIITKDFLEEHSNEILDKLPADNVYHEYLNYMVLGALIIDRKAKMPQELKERILQALSWEAELTWRWKWIDKEKEKDFLTERKNLIESFRQLIVDYPSKKT